MSEKSETQWYSLSKKLTHWETVYIQILLIQSFPGFTLQDFYIVMYCHIFFTDISNLIAFIFLVSPENGHKCIFQKYWTKIVHIQK